MSYLYLIFAIVFEISGTTMMKLSNGFTVLWPSIGLFVSYAISFSFLNFALKTIEVGVAYAIWGAVGTTLIVAIGILFFHESVNIVKILSIGLVILGVIGLNLSGVSH